MRFHVAGVGSIGTLLAHHLRLSVDPKHAIVLLHKTEQRMRNASQLDPPISVIADGVTQSSSGYLHELSDKSPPPRPRWTPFAVRKKQAEKRQTAEAMRSNSSEHAEPESDYPDQFEDETSADGPIDSLFVATKAHAIVPLMHQLYPRIRPSSTIVLLHNGMGVYERLVRDIFRNRENRPHFILTSNTHAAYTVGSGKVVYSSHRGKGALQFGIVPDARSRDFEVRQTTLSGDRAFSLGAISSPQDSEAIHYSSLRNTVAVLSNLTGLNASWQSYDDIIMAIKRKLVVNSVINPLTAIMNCRNGDIIESPNTYRIARAVCEEAALVFALQYNQRMLDEGRPFALPRTALPKDHYKTSILSRIPHQLRADSLMYEIIRVAKATALNTSSMVQDIRANRPTEIDYLNGYLYRLGRQYNVRMSTNAYLVNMVKLRQDVPIDVVQDLPPRTVDVRDKRAPSAEKLVARAWALVAARKFKRTKFKWRWQMRAITLQRKAREKAMLEKLMGS